MKMREREKGSFITRSNILDFTKFSNLIFKNAHKSIKNNDTYKNG